MPPSPPNTQATTSQRPIKESGRNMAKSFLLSLVMALMMMMVSQSFVLPIGKQASSSRVHYPSNKMVLYADGGVSMADGGAVESCKRKIQEALQPVELIVSQSSSLLSHILLPTSLYSLRACVMCTCLSSHVQQNSHRSNHPMMILMEVTLLSRSSLLHLKERIEYSDNS